MNKIKYLLLISALSGCASVKYPNWDMVNIVYEAPKDCTSAMVNEMCNEENEAECMIWYKKRATVFVANTVMLHKTEHSKYAEYFTCDNLGYTQRATPSVKSAPPIALTNSKTAIPEFKTNISKSYEPKPDSVEAKEPVCVKQSDKYPEKKKINIKGYYLGMNKCEIDPEVIKLYSNFTVAEVETTVHFFEFIDDKVSAFIVGFKEKDFLNVLEAIKNKYHGIKCNNSEVNNRFGAKFEQISCKLFYPDGVLAIERYASNVENSSISLISNKSLEKVKKDQDIRNQDL